MTDQSQRTVSLNADGSSQLMDVHPVPQTARPGPTRVFDLHRDGNLLLLNADGSSHLMDVNPVQAIAGAGATSVFDLHKDGNLITTFEGTTDVEKLEKAFNIK